MVDILQNSTSYWPCFGIKRLLQPYQKQGISCIFHSLFRLKCQFLFPEFTELHKVSSSWITLVIGEEWCFLKCTMFWNEVLHLWHPTPNMSFWIVHTHNYAMIFYIVISTLSDLTSRYLCSAYKNLGINSWIFRYPFLFFLTSWVNSWEKTRFYSIDLQLSGFSTWTSPFCKYIFISTNILYDN